MNLSDEFAIEIKCNLVMDLSIVLRRNPNLETRAAFKGFLIQLSVHIET